MRSFPPAARALVFLLAAGCGAGAAAAPGPDAPPRASVTPALHATGAVSAERIAALRGRGEAGVAELAAEVDREADPARRAELEDALDQVAQQRDAVASRLYWHTDLEAAKRDAKATGRPILSLRLLGKLTEELSCANSRFFRTALYPNADVRRALAGYVLHWSSERPAPRITIDFGDGRVVTRTITGNSIHYALDEEGRPLDAMPGLVGPAAFARWLREASAVAREAKAGVRSDVVRAYHQASLAKVVGRYRNEAALVGAPPMPVFLAAPPVVTGKPAAPTAMTVAPSKAMVEAPPLRRFAPAAPPPAVDEIPWARFAALPAYAEAARLDAAGRAMVARKGPRDWSDPKSPRPLDAEGIAALIAAFERSIAEDTAKNTLGLHASVHAWLAEDPGQGFDALNTLVYRSLFLTPADDPWLGLVPAGAFSGIADDGISRAR